MKQETIDIIKDTVLRHYFCNVDADNWPEAPFDFLEKYYDMDSWGSIVDNGLDDTNKDYRRMEIWEPFVLYTDFPRMVSDSIESYTHTVNKILVIENK